MKTEEMTQAASAFAKNAHELANKYKNRKFFWIYQQVISLLAYIYVLLLFFFF